MDRRVCGWCQARSNLDDLLGSTTVTAYASDPLVAGRYIAMVAYRCQGCGLLSLAYATDDDAEVDPYPDSSWIRQFVEDANDAQKRWLPEQVVRHEYPDVPTHIADAASEAQQSFAVGRLRSAVLLARAVIEAVAKDQGITTGKLVAKIDEMHTRGLVRQHIREGAHEIRHLGNDMAHGDFVASVDMGDAGLVMALMDEMLVEVYQSPARVARFQARRAARAITTNH